MAQFKTITITSQLHERVRIPLDAPEEIDLLLEYLHERGDWNTFDEEITSREITCIERPCPGCDTLLFDWMRQCSNCGRVVAR